MSHNNSSLHRWGIFSNVTLSIHPNQYHFNLYPFLISGIHVERLFQIF